MKDGKTKVMDNILIPPNSNVFIIGFKNIEVIEYCINCDANLVVGVDVNLELVEMIKNKYFCKTPLQTDKSMVCSLKKNAIRKC